MFDRDAILAAVDLRSLANEMLGPHAGTERSPTWPCPNPHHAQTGRTPPVNVFTSHRGEQRWRCHGCGEGGTAIDLVMTCRGTDLRGALEQLNERAGHPPPTALVEPNSRSRRIVTPVRGDCADPHGLATYVEKCAEKLWLPEGRPVRRWLTGTRGLPEEVLRRNRIGADLGARRQPRPRDMCRTGGAVLPVISQGQVIYAQVRVVRRGSDLRYLNPSSALALNPRLARYRPPKVEHPEIMVTEGAIDALSANAAGYRAVAILSAAYPDRDIAHALSRLPHRLVVAFDGDDAGRRGADRLQSFLAAEMRPAAALDLDHGDLNDAMLRSKDWSSALSAQVSRATANERAPERPSVAR